MNIRKENEKKKEYLLRYKTHKKEAERYERDIDEYRSCKIIQSLNNSGMPTSHSKKDLSDYIVKIDEIISKTIMEKYMAVEACKEIRERIELLENDYERDVLTYRYIYNWSWDKIAEHEHYSVKQIQRIHGNALRNFTMS